MMVIKKSAYTLAIQKGGNPLQLMEKVLNGTSERRTSIIQMESHCKRQPVNVFTLIEMMYLGFQILLYGQELD